MDYNNILTQAITNKFDLEIINQFGVSGGSDFFMISQIGKKLKELFNKLNNEYKKCNKVPRDDNDNIIAEYYLLEIRKGLYLNNNNKILDDGLVELLNKEQNVNLRNSFEEIINYIVSLPYIENDNDYNNEFVETYNFMKDILDDKNTDIIDLESGISYFEELKNNFRGRNQQAFEYYDKLQEKYFQLLETKFNVKYDNVPDQWN